MAEYGVPYTLTTPAGTLTFNDTTSGSYFWLSDVSGFDAPPLRTTVEDVPQRDGSRVFDSYDSALRPVFRGQIVAPGAFATRLAMEDELRAKLRSLRRASGTLTWTPSGQTARQRTVRLSEGLQVSGQVQKEFLFSLIAPDPLAYSVTQQSVTSSGVAAGTMFGPSFFMFFTSTVGGLTSVTPGGNAETYPLVRLWGPGTDATISNLTTGLFVTLFGVTLAAGEYVDIDMRAETMTKSDGTNMLRYLTAGNSQFFSLLPGVVNNLWHTVSSGATGSTHADVYWNDAWA